MKDNKIGVLSLLGIVFIVLKLTRVIDWNWLIVTLPFWIDPFIVLMFLIGYSTYRYFNPDIKCNSKPEPTIKRRNTCKPPPPAPPLSRTIRNTKKSKFQQKIDNAMEKARSNN